MGVMGVWGMAPERRRTADRLLVIADPVSRVDIAPMHLLEIDAVVRAMREARCQGSAYCSPKRPRSGMQSCICSFGRN